MAFTWERGDARLQAAGTHMDRAALTILSMGGDGAEVPRRGGGEVPRRGGAEVPRQQNYASFAWKHRRRCV